MNKRLVGTSELARTLGFSVPTIWAMVRRGEIPAVAVGGRYRFDVDEVLATLKRVRADHPKGKRP